MTAGADNARFLALLAAHKRILYKVANAYCRGHEDRNDLLQEMVIQLWRSFPRYDARQTFSTWMYRVAMNVAISFYRREARRTRDVVPLEEFGLEVAGADQALADASEELRELHRLIRTLDELNRALIILYLDGYSHAEIAGMMGISATNVATRVGRIKERLQSTREA